MLAKNSRRLLIASASALALGGCGANDIASPGTGGNVIINNPAPSPSPSPTPTPTGALVTPAADCPAIAGASNLTNSGTISGPTGEWRVCTLPARFTASTTLPKIKGLLYSLGGRVDVGTDQGASSVGNNVTLTIEPGVILFGNTGVSWLAVNRGNQINAVGTATQPIIFTSRENVVGTNNDQSIGQWGGIVLMGRAPVTDCTVGTGATPGTAACQRNTEGAVDPAYYGGATVDDSSGKMSYVQIRFSGYILTPGNELQSLTTEGVGNKTQIDHIMSFNSSDDGAEFFGGRVNMKYYISVGADDDNLDTDTGLKGNFQYVIVAQRSTGGDAIIEADTDSATDGDTPRQNTYVSNATFLYRSPGSSDQAAILLRGGTDYTLVNTVLTSPNYPCLNISRAQTASGTADAAIDEAGAPVFKSVAMQCGPTKYVASADVGVPRVQAIFGAGTNNNSDTFSPTLTGGFINGANETAVPAFDASTLVATSGTAGFFDKTTYIGAVKDANDTWYKGWTCNSATADFGTGNSGLCTSLPTS